MDRLAKFIECTSNLELIKKELSSIHEYDIAQLLEILDSENRKKIYEIYDSDKMADIISFLDEDVASELMEEMSIVDKAEIINEMEPDDAVDLLKETTEEEQDKILDLVDEELREDIKNLSEYPEYTAGAYMTTRFVSFEVKTDVKKAMKDLVKIAPDVESINTIFVLDGEKLVGKIKLKDLIIAKMPCLVDDIMYTNFKFVSPDTDIEVASKIIRDYDIYDLPVLDNGIMKGIITMDDAIDSVLEEASEDYARLAGLTTDQEEGESIFKTIKKRIPWLAILLILDLFVPLISSAFNFMFTKEGISIIMIFIPVILGLAGNSATQSLAITIRNIANESINTKKVALKHLLVEVTIGLITGIILGALGFGLSYLMLLINKFDSLSIINVSMVIAIATLISLVLSNLIGAIVPITLYKLKKDPAVASGPFITTLVDISSTVIYFVLALVLLYNVL